MTVPTPVLVPMGPDHLAGAVALSAVEGWPHRRDDWSMVLSNSRGVVGLSGDRVVATAMVTPFGSVATVNMVVVADSLRGQGLGRRLVEAAMAQIPAATWRLVATERGRPLYERLGFEPCGEVRQHQGIARAASGLRSEDWAEPADLPALIALDRAATGMDRGWLIETLMRDGRILVLRQDGKVEGIAPLRRFGRGEVAGPVVARGEGEAQALLAGLLAHRAGRFLRVDVPVGPGLGLFLALHGLEPVGGGFAMRRGLAAPVSSLHRRFALASQALG